MDIEWKIAEIRGTLYGALLKIDTIAAENKEYCKAQTALQEALELLEDVH